MHASMAMPIGRVENCRWPSFRVAAFMARLLTGVRHAQNKQASRKESNKPAGQGGRGAGGSPVQPVTERGATSTRQAFDGTQLNRAATMAGLRIWRVQASCLLASH